MVEATDLKARYPIFALAEASWDANKTDCSGFVRAVALAAGVPLGGMANNLVDYWNAAPGWIKLGNKSFLASQMAEQGYLVVAGEKHTPHGHVVVVVPGSEHGHAMGYWGQLHRIGLRDASLSKAWRPADLKKVQYFAFPVRTLKARQ